MTRNSEKQSTIRKLSSCVTKKFNSFHIATLEYGKKLRKTFKQIDIIYNPVKKSEDRVNCYFSRELHLVYRSTYTEGDVIKHSTAFQCYYCNNFYRKKNHKHIECCSGILGIVYIFNNKNLISFEDNIIYKGDLSLVAYMDFETTAPTDNCINPAQRKMFVFSYVIVFAFYPKLNFDRVIVQRGFGHSLKKSILINQLPTI